MNDAAAQTMMAPLAWLALIIAVNVVLFQIPTHVALHTMQARSDRRRSFV